MTDKILMSAIPMACLTSAGLEGIKCVRPMAEQIDAVMKEDASYEVALLDAQDNDDGVIDDQDKFDAFVAVLKTKIEGGNGDEEAIAKEMTALWATAVGLGYVGKDFESADTKKIKELQSQFEDLLDAQEDPETSRLKASLRGTGTEPASKCKTYGEQFSDIIGKAVNDVVDAENDPKKKIEILEAMVRLLTIDSTQEIVYTFLPKAVKTKIEDSSNKDKAEKLLKGEFAIKPDDTTTKTTQTGAFNAFKFDLAPVAFHLGSELPFAYKGYNANIGIGYQHIFSTQMLFGLGLKYSINPMSVKKSTPGQASTMETEVMHEFSGEIEFGGYPIMTNDNMLSVSVSVSPGGAWSPEVRTENVADDISGQFTLDLALKLAYLRRFDSFCIGPYMTAVYNVMPLNKMEKNGAEGTTRVDGGFDLIFGVEFMGLWEQVTGSDKPAENTADVEGGK